MRVAIVSDVHGNLVALEAVLADLDREPPDLVVHGGDLALFGPRPDACVDLIRQRGWPGVLGSTDEVLWHRAPNVKIPEESVAWTREKLEPTRIDWLRGQRMEWRQGGDLALVHATPGDLWRGVMPFATDAELEAVFGPLGASVVAYCHIHVPYVRRVGKMTVANCGSVSIPLDGDPRPSYLVITDGQPEPRRIEFDLERSVVDAEASGHPSAGWIAKRMRTAGPG